MDDMLTGGHRGQYSDAVLSELENQNDQQVEGMTAKVRMLKDVSATILRASCRPDFIDHYCYW